MRNLLRPSTLLARAVRCHTAGDVGLGEKLFLECAALYRAKRRFTDPADAEAVRTAQFYLALLNCQRGQFHVADKHLAQLGLAARLSDGIWAEACSQPRPSDFFVRVVDGGVPARLVQQLRECLGPESVYWEDHRYDEDSLAFYSHAHHPGDTAHLVDHLIEGLRPLLLQVAPEVARSLTLAEWWVHQRRPDQWHGHPLHFDTHEQLLRDSRGVCVQHPAVSTVVYLSDASPRFGPTLVTNQRARAAGGDEVATVVHPRRGRVLLFDGQYLHGALPGRPWLAPASDVDRRLCVMIGWWTSAIASQPPTDPPRPVMKTDPAARWVRELAGTQDPGPPAKDVRTDEVEARAIAPIWSDVETKVQGTPFFGRYFLTHRGQVDEDIFN